MKDIAEHFGVSIATVSRALNGSERVSEEKRKLICEYAHEHNFYPNDIAKSLRNSHKQPVKVIGVIVPEFTHYYFSSILNGIEDAASKRGYRIIATTSREQYDREVQLCQMFEAHQVCGVIVSQAKETQDYAHFQSLIDRGIPLVFYDRICTGVDASRVVVDDYQGAFIAVTHLIETGCRRIAFYGMKGKTALGQNRYNGYHDALLKAGMQPDESLVFVCDNREDAERITPDILRREDRPDAFFCVNDDTAIGVMYTAKHNGFRVPDGLHASLQQGVVLRPAAHYRRAARNEGGRRGCHHTHGQGGGHHAAQPHRKARRKNKARRKREHQELRRQRISPPRKKNQKTK